VFALSAEVMISLQSVLGVAVCQDAEQFDHRGGGLPFVQRPGLQVGLAGKLLDITGGLYVIAQLLGHCGDKLPGVRRPGLQVGLLRHCPKLSG
jgi:hypothetical protein